MGRAMHAGLSIVSCHLLRRNLTVMKGGKSDLFAMLVLRSHALVITDPPCIVVVWLQSGGALLAINVVTLLRSGPVSTGMGDHSRGFVID